MSGFCLERKRERKESSGMRDRGRQSGGASNQWPACFVEVCACVRLSTRRCVCVRNCGRVCGSVWGSVPSQPPEIMQASNNEQIEPPHADTHTHAYVHTSPAQGQAQRQGSRGVLAVGGSEKQIMINWLTFYKTLPLMHLG